MSAPGPIPTDAPAGLAGALRALGGTALEMLHTRTELLALEMAQERDRLIELMLYTGLALLFLSLTMFLGGVLFVAAWWETPYRTAACLVALLLPVFAATGCVVVLRKRLAGGGRPFGGSLDNLAADFRVQR